MAENSSISWTDHTFSPWHGCTKVGPGCDHCYAESTNHRYGFDNWGHGKPRRLIKDWSNPRKWQRQAEKTGVRPWVFCASMSDIFDNEVPDEWRYRAWDLVRETPLLRWIFVTKRIGNAAKMLPADWTSGAFAHCGLVSTIVNQTEANRDIPKLLATPAARRGLSMEPLLGPVDRFTVSTPGWPHCERINALTGGGRSSNSAWLSSDQKLDWIIVGGESGPGARPMHPQWARDIRDQCAAAGVPFHFKQWGAWLPYGQEPPDFATGDLEDTAAHGTTFFRVGKARAGRLLDDREWNGMPDVRETAHG